MVADDARDAIAGFVDTLKRLRSLAGEPTLRRMAELTRDAERPLSRSTIFEKLKGEALPEWSFVESFFAACRMHAPGKVRPELRATLRSDYETMLGIVEGDRRRTRLAAEAAEQRRRLDMPCLLPPPARHFVGRAAELESLDELVEAGGAVVVSAIDGTAGIGKSAVAVRWAHRVADRFPDGQLYVNLRGFDPGGSAVTPAQAARRFLDALAVPPERIPLDPDAVIDLYRSQLADRRVLVLLDNAATADQVRPLLPGRSGCVAVVTSRNRLSSLVAIEGARPLTLGLLSLAEARELLARQLGRRRLAFEPQATEEIILRCARLPLALTILAARAATREGARLAEFARELRDAGRSLDALDLGEDDAAANVRAVFSWSYGQLSPAAARLFRLLGVHPGPDIGPVAAASLAGVGVATVLPVLDELARAHLIEEHEPGRYAFHDLLRAYAGEWAATVDPEADRREALHRTIDHYLHTTYAASLLWDPHRDPIPLGPPRPGAAPEDLADRERALAWLTAEYPVLRNTVEQAAAAGFTTETWQLAWSLVDFANRQGHWRDWLAMQRVSLDASRRAADLAGQARSHRGLGRAFAVVDRLADSHRHLAEAFTLFDRLGDAAGRGHTHIDLSRTYDREGDPRNALDQSEKALACFEAAGHPVGEANARNGVGWYHAQLGNYDQTLAQCTLALTLLTELDDSAGQAATLDSLGYAYHHLGDFPAAIECFTRAVALFGENVDHFSEADTLTRLGDSHLAAGDAGAARDAWERALRLFDQLAAVRYADDVRARLTALE